jgi:hypothetical protein
MAAHTMQDLSINYQRFTQQAPGNFPSAKGLVALRCRVAGDNPAARALLESPALRLLTSGKRSG